MRAGFCPELQGLFRKSRLGCGLVGWSQKSRVSSFLFGCAKTQVLLVSILENLLGLLIGENTVTGIIAIPKAGTGDGDSPVGGHRVMAVFNDARLTEGMPTALHDKGIGQEGFVADQAALGSHGGSTGRLSDAQSAPRSNIAGSKIPKNKTPCVMRRRPRSVKPHSFAGLNESRVARQLSRTSKGERARRGPLRRSFRYRCHIDRQRLSTLVSHFHRRDLRRDSQQRQPWMRPSLRTCLASRVPSWRR